MNKRFGTLVALAAITAQAGIPTAGAAQQSDISREISELSEQCDYIWDNRDDRSLLQRELDLLLGDSDQSLTCRFDTPPELRDSCEEQCIGLIVSLLGETPIAQLPGADEPYN